METTETTPTSPEITLPPGTSLWNFWVTTLTRPKAEVYSALLDRYAPDQEHEETLSRNTVLIMMALTTVRRFIVGLVVLLFEPDFPSGIPQWLMEDGLSYGGVIVFAVIGALSVITFLFSLFVINIIAGLFTEKGSLNRLIVMAGGYGIPSEIARLLLAIVLSVIVISAPGILEYEPAGMMLYGLGCIGVVGGVLYIIYVIAIDISRLRAVYDLSTGQAWGVIGIEFALLVVFRFVAGLFTAIM